MPMKWPGARRRAEQVRKGKAQGLAALLQDHRLNRVAKDAAERAVADALDGRVGHRHESVTQPTMRLMGMLGSTLVEVAAAHGLTTEEFRALLRRRTDLRMAYDQGLAETKKNLRRKQIEKALKGDSTMLIWMGKQLLNQHDKPGFTQPTLGDEAQGQRTVTIAWDEDLESKWQKATEGLDLEAIEREVFGGEPVALPAVQADDAADG